MVSLNMIRIKLFLKTDTSTVKHSSFTHTLFMMCIRAFSADNHTNPNLLLYEFFHELWLFRKYQNIHSIWNYNYDICNSFYSHLPIFCVSDFLNAFTSFATLVLPETNFNFLIVFLNIPTHDFYSYIPAYWKNILFKN